MRNASCSGVSTLSWYVKQTSWKGFADATASGPMRPTWRQQARAAPRQHAWVVRKAAHEPHLRGWCGRRRARGRRASAARAATLGTSLDRPSRSYWWDSARGWSYKATAAFLHVSSKRKVEDDNCSDFVSAPLSSGGVVFVQLPPPSTRCPPSPPPPPTPPPYCPPLPQGTMYRAGMLDATLSHTPTIARLKRGHERRERRARRELERARREPVPAPTPMPTPWAVASLAPPDTCTPRQRELAGEEALAELAPVQHRHAEAAPRLPPDAEEQGVAVHKVRHDGVVVPLRVVALRCLRDRPSLRARLGLGSGQNLAGVGRKSSQI